MTISAERERMINHQLIRRGIEDPRVIDAMRTVPRHEFVSATFREHAYSDEPLPIGEGQTISQPYIVALMTEALQLRSGERVLEIGTGSGYQAAIMAQMGTEVYSVERLASLETTARDRLRMLGYGAVQVQSRGWQRRLAGGGTVRRRAAHGGGTRGSPFTAATAPRDGTHGTADWR